MPIKLTQSYGGYTAGQVVTLSDQDEINFVERGVASYANNPQTVPAVLSCDPVTGAATALVHPVTGENVGAKHVSLVANNPGAASANTLALQSALDVGGLVVVHNPGVYTINATLKIGGNTELRLAPGVEIKALGAGVGNLLNTKVMSEAKTTVTLGYTANSLLVTVNWAAHNLTTRDAVWITGADQYQYLGVFPIVSVTDANSFVVKVRRRPTAAATGTIQAVRAQRNTKVVGGVWNYNLSGGNDPGFNFNANAIRLGGVYNLILQDIEARDTKKYAVEVGATTQFSFRGGTGSGLASDFMKLRGPLFNAVVESIDTAGGDDIVSVQTREPAAYEAYNWTWGDCIGVRLSGLGGYSTTAGIVLYPSVASGIIDSVIVDGYNGSVTANPHIRIDNNGVGTGLVGTVIINNPVFSGTQSAISISGAMVMDSLIVNNPKMDSASNGGRLLYLSAHSIYAKVKVTGGSISGTESLVNTSASGLLRFEFDNVTVDNSIYNGFVLQGSATIHVRLRNMVFNANPNNVMFSIVGASSPTIEIDADTISNSSGLHTVSVSGTPTLRVRGPGFQCDHAVFTPVAGSVTYNTNAAYGTGVGLYATGAGSPVKLS